MNLPAPTITIRNEHHAAIDAALAHLWQNRTPNKKKSYNLSAYRVAAPIIHALVDIQGRTDQHPQQLISSAIDDSMGTNAPKTTDLHSCLERLIHQKVSAQSLYRVIFPLVSWPGIPLKPRKFNGTSIRMGSVVCHKGKLLSTTLGKDSVSTVRRRQTALENCNKEYLPPNIASPAYIIATTWASNADRAQAYASHFVHRYLAIMNFIRGLKHFTSYDSNPMQPIGHFLLGSYTTVHAKGDDTTIYYESDRICIRPNRFRLNQPDARKLDGDYEYIVAKVKAHFDPETIWKGLELYGKAALTTNTDSAYSLLWNCLELLMFTQRNETHKSLLKRAHGFCPEVPDEMLAGITESMRHVRNTLIHESRPIVRTGGLIPMDPMSFVRATLHGLLHFHIKCPNCIHNKEDFIAFTGLPFDIKSLDKRIQLSSLQKSICTRRTKRRQSKP